jgi:amidase
MRVFGFLRKPAAEDVAGYAASLGWDLKGAELDAYVGKIGLALDALDRVEDLPLPDVDLKWPARRVLPPAPDEYNSWITRCEVSGASEGPLAGRTVGVKDCIAVAGVPMTNGGRRTPVLVPTEDAVVIERLLDAGATITGKTNLEDLGAGLGEGSAYGAARNPVDPTRSTGGSSSGSGSAVAAGEVDMALGADEGGSVRIPAAWCGLVGMKATHGLVPSYGMSYMNHTIDHIGPMTKTVRDNALMLEVIAGPDWRDPQWTTDMPDTFSYLSAEGKGIASLRIGILTEGLEPVGASPDVIAAFEAAAKVLQQLGATVSNVSVPLWVNGWALGSAGLAAGTHAMVTSFGTGSFSHLGRIDPQAVAINVAQSALGGDHLPPMFKSMLLTVEHVKKHYGMLPYVKAHNLRLELRKQVNAALADVDVLIMPTTPEVAHPLLTAPHGPEEFIDGRVHKSTANTSPTDLTGHPSLTVPCGTGEAGMPVGLQIVGPRYAEELLYRVGFAYEAARG